MDIRIEKTQRAIKNAFLELRAKKPLEKITVKELCALACVNKSTFYSHYEDIFALSEFMESETITSIEIFTRNLYIAFLSNDSLINILFSGRERARLGDCLETELRKLMCARYPEYKEDIEWNILLSYCVQGSFHAYLNYKDRDPDAVIRVIEKVVQALKPLYLEHIPGGN